MLIRMLYFAATVSDLNRSVAFYHDQLGMRVQRKFEVTGSALEQATQLPGAHVKVAELQNFDGHLFRLVEFVSPKGNQQYEAKFTDIGHTHRTIMMPSIREHYERLASKGVRFFSPPVEPMPDTFPELKFAYMLDPDGLVLEMLQYSVFHSARTVSDRDKSRAFYIDTLGMSLWVTREAKGPGIEQGTRIPGAHLLITHAAVGNDSLELIYFVGKKGDHRPTRINDVGCCYPVYLVDDIQKYHSDLRSKGVNFLSAPVRQTGETPEYMSVYLTDPDQYLVEFRQAI